MNRKVRYRGAFAIALLLVASAACATLPKPPKPETFRFPKDVYLDAPKRAYTVIGTVRAKEDFNTITSDLEVDQLCKNFYNKAMNSLLKMGRGKGADAVIEARSVVFLEDGRVEMYKTPECSDDGGIGQILAQGTAIKWKPETAVPR